MLLIPKGAPPLPPTLTPSPPQDLIPTRPTYYVTSVFPDPWSFRLRSRALVMIPCREVLCPWLGPLPQKLSSFRPKPVPIHRETAPLLHFPTFLIKIVPLSRRLECRPWASLILYIPLGTPNLVCRLKLLGACEQSSCLALRLVPTNEENLLFPWPITLPRKTASFLCSRRRLLVATPMLPTLPGTQTLCVFLGELGPQWAQVGSFAILLSPIQEENSLLLPCLTFLMKTVPLVPRLLIRRPASLMLFNDRWPKSPLPLKTHLTFSCLVPTRTRVLNLPLPPETTFLTNIPPFLCRLPRLRLASPMFPTLPGTKIPLVCTVIILPASPLTSIKEGTHLLFCFPSLMICFTPFALSRPPPLLLEKTRLKHGWLSLGPRWTLRTFSMTGFFMDRRSDSCVLACNMVELKPTSTGMIRPAPQFSSTRLRSLCLRRHLWDSLHPPSLL